MVITIAMFWLSMLVILYLQIGSALSFKTFNCDDICRSFMNTIHTNEDMCSLSDFKEYTLGTNQRYMIFNTCKESLESCESAETTTLTPKSTAVSLYSHSTSVAQVNPRKNRKPQVNNRKTRKTQVNNRKTRIPQVNNRKTKVASKMVKKNVVQQRNLILKTFGSECQTDKDCGKIPLMTCIKKKRKKKKNKCGCVVGYGLDKKKGECRKMIECKTLASSYQYYNHIVLNSNPRQKFRIDRGQCRAKCLEMRSFTCKFATMAKIPILGTPTCSLYDKTWLEYPDHNTPNYEYIGGVYQRLCQIFR